MHFDNTISLGSIVTLAGFIITIVTLHTANVRNITRLETKLDIMFSWFSKRYLNDVFNEEKNIR